MEINIRKRLWIILVAMLCFLPFFHIQAKAKPIYTGNTKVDYAAEKIIKRCTKPEMTKQQKLKAVYNYLVKHMRYSHSKGSVKLSSTRKQQKEYRFQVQTLRKDGRIKYSSKFSSDYINLLTLQGTCKDMSGVFCILANHLGYEAGYVTGRYVRSNGSSTEHWWNYVKVKGSKRYCDVQAANDSWKRHHSQSAVQGFYLRRKDSDGWRKHHRG